ncbi:Pol protein [Phytophthora palmivora]|uniref:Pol protein n=1 Tax=Phytophthora palmivora TaxID=4796 RepID=A0A2P4XYN8_9STRA|nr:Pol protein [Phytophthora palmivora]
MDLAVKFEDFDSTESFLVLDMDKYDLILGMQWLEKHEPWIDWRCKIIGASRPAVSDRPLVSNVRTSVRGWGATEYHQDAYASEEVMRVAESNEDVAMSPATGLPDGTDQAGTIGPQTAEAAEESAKGISSVDNIGTVVNDFLVELKAGYIAEMVFLKPETSSEDLNSSSVMDEDVLEGFMKQRATRLGSEILKNPEDPVYPLVKEYSDVVSKHPPSQLPPDREYGTSLTSCLAQNAFFAEKAKSGMVRESKSPHSTPTLCVRKPNGKWRLVHAYNKMNNATVPAQTPIPRKDMLLDNMSGCTLYSALDLVDGYYQILMRESDIPLTA